MRVCAPNLRLLPNSPQQGHLVDALFRPAGALKKNHNLFISKFPPKCSGKGVFTCVAYDSTGAENPSEVENSLESVEEHREAGERAIVAGRPDATARTRLQPKDLTVLESMSMMMGISSIREQNCTLGDKIRET